MTYESQGIFAEGRGIAIAKEAGSGQNQSCKGKRGESRKKKRQSVCECCGITYEPDLKAKGRFCSYDCFFKDKKSDMERLKPCLSCHSLLGMTGAASGRMLNLSKFQICKYRKRMGLRTLSNGEAQIKSMIKASNMLPWWGDRDSAQAWMSDYKPRFFDWSNHSLWLAMKSSRHMMKRYNSDMDFRIRHNLRCDIRQRVKKNDGRKAHKTETMLGCSVSHFRNHLESTFDGAMSWANYGVYWEIDHIVPVSWFDMKNPDHQLRCWHYSNLRALSKKKNRKRGNRASPQVVMTHILNDLNPTPGRNSRASAK